MPRVARIKGETGFYHITLRGNGRRILFEDDDDRMKYLALLQRFACSDDFYIMAYCLMDNHVHLLIYACEEKLDAVMKQMSVTYAKYFNNRWGHVGHVFQGRYGSVPIESDHQLLATVRYVHRNPEEAHVSSASDYTWSSYGAYMGMRSFVRTEMVLEMLHGPDGFRELCEPYEYEPKVINSRSDNEECSHAAKQILQLASLELVSHMSRYERDDAIRKLLLTGMSIRQIERTLGIGRGVISRVSSKLSHWGQSPT